MKTTSGLHSALENAIQDLQSVSGLVQALEIGASQVGEREGALEAALRGLRYFIDDRVAELKKAVADGQE